VTRDWVETVLITGASGYLGSLVAAAFLVDGPSRLVLPIRRGRDPESVVAGIAKESSTGIAAFPNQRGDPLRGLRQLLRHQEAQGRECAAHPSLT